MTYISWSGAAYAANANNSPSKIKLGITLGKASLILLLAMFLAFMALIVIFHRRCIVAGVLTHDTRTIIYVLYASGFLILVRNIFRTASFFYPPTSPANGDEVFFWLFEALPMLANTFLLNIFPPAKYIPKNHKTYLARDGKTEIEGPGMVDRRHFLMTLVDPFDLVAVQQDMTTRIRLGNMMALVTKAPPYRPWVSPRSPRLGKLAPPKHSDRARMMLHSDLDQLFSCL